MCKWLVVDWKCSDTALYMVVQMQITDLILLGSQSGAGISKKRKFQRYYLLVGRLSIVEDVFAVITTDF